MRWDKRCDESWNERWVEMKFQIRNEKGATSRVSFTENQTNTVFADYYKTCSSLQTLWYTWAWQRRQSYLCIWLWAHCEPFCWHAWSLLSSVFVYHILCASKPLTLIGTEGLANLISTEGGKLCPPLILIHIVWNPEPILIQFDLFAPEFYPHRMAYDVWHKYGGKIGST
jgi:hypothetical protein